MNAFVDDLSAALNFIPNTQQSIAKTATSVESGVDVLKKAVGAQLVMQALLVAGTAYLCYVAYQETKRKGR